MKENNTSIKLKKCGYCDEVMIMSNGCSEAYLEMNGGKPHKRIAVGEKFDLYYGQDNKKLRCRDCNALYGHYHHEGCDVEICPICHEQLISCDC